MGRVAFLHPLFAPALASWLSLSFVNPRTHHHSRAQAAACPTSLLLDAAALALISIAFSSRLEKILISWLEVARRSLFSLSECHLLLSS